MARFVGLFFFLDKEIIMIKLEGERISLTLEIKPMACPRPRVAGKFAYMPTSYLEWKNNAMTQIRNAIKIRHIADPVFLVLSFVYQRPQCYMRKCDPAERMLKGTKPDLDNLCKSVMDALQQCKVIQDDSQIVGLMAHKWYGAKRSDKKSERNHIKIDIYPVKG